MILLLLMLGFCLYGSRMYMKGSVTPVTAEQTNEAETAQTDLAEAGEPDEEPEEAVFAESAERQDEREQKKYPIETIYEDEGHKHVIYGNLTFDMSADHLVKIVKEEDRTIFVTDIDGRNAESYRRSEMTYIFSKEPDLAIANYKEAVQYFEERLEYRNFISYSYPENTAKNNVCDLYMATVEDGKTYYLIKCKGEEGLYRIEASADVGILRWVTGCLGNQYKEYEYSVKGIECAEGQTARVERFFYPNEHRADYKVTSDWLNYTAKLQSRESEDSACTHALTMDIEITRETGQIKSQRLQWVCDGVEEGESIYPDPRDMHFQDADRDGYLDFMPVTDVTVRESWWAVFVWDGESEEYAKVTVEDSLFPDTVASYPQFYAGYMVQDTVVGFYEQRLERYRWEGNKLIFDDMIRTRSVDENDDADPYTMTMIYDKEQNEFVPMDNETLRKLCDDFRADRE